MKLVAGFPFLIKRGLVVIATLVLLNGCVSRLFYHPNTTQYRTPESFSEGVREMYFESLDGTRLHGWFAPARSADALGTIVHFHGNAQNLTAHSSFVEWLPDEGYNVFLFDYRGYGKSEGRPSRRGVFEDGVAALRFVRTLPGVDTNRVIILGQSLGAANALAIAGTYPELAGQAIISDSGFYSYRRIVRDKIRLIPILSLLRVPLSWLVITDAYSPSAVVANITPTPVLFMHGTADLVIPVHHAQLLYDKAADPRSLLIVTNGQHISGLYEYRTNTIPAVLCFMSNALHHTRNELHP